MAVSFDNRKRKFADFLVHDHHQDKYTQRIRQAIDNDSFRVVVNINDIRSSEGGAATAGELIREPRENLLALQEAAMDTAREMGPQYEKLLRRKSLQVGVEGSFGAHSVSPRGLTSRLLNKLVEVEGIVVKCSSVRPKMMQSVQYCAETKEYTIRDYRDATSMNVGVRTGDGAELLPTNSALPAADTEGHALETEHGLCQYKDYQAIVLQEMPEKSRVGQLPRSVDVILEHDLVDHCKPGDRVLCSGVYRALPSSMGGQTSGVFRTVLMCNHVAIMGKEVGAVRLTVNDTRNIHELSQKPDILSILADSLCPSIFGHAYVKKAIVLQLLGGCERIVDNGTHLRGDINIMMVGDPSTAKSQLLRAVMDIAPLAISTTGRGSSGVGLTAAVTADHETSEKRLEAGAMVLADRGVVCIDEFDKMSEVDRVAIHEVMEQQTVTIAKAGIHAQLNARCSVIAAANPIYGQYDKSRSPQHNIALPDSLLSRFDLLFIVLDQLDPALDRRLSEHVIRSHQYRRPGTVMEPEPLNQQSSLNLDDTTDHNAAVDSPVWLRSGNTHTDVAAQRGEHDVLTKDFLRKYIHFAKQRYQPVLSEAASEQISEAYSAMRAQTSKKNLPITPRTLETIIRLSTASAKCRLSESVDVQDVDVAMSLINFVLFHDVGAAPTLPAPSSQAKASASAEDDEEDDRTSTEGDDALQSSEESVENSRLYQVVQDILTSSTADNFLISEIARLVKAQTAMAVDNEQLMRVLMTLEELNKVMLDGDVVAII